MVETAKITVETSQDQLPQDVSTLQGMVLTLLGQIDDLQGQMYYLKRQLFGKKSEKLDPAQFVIPTKNVSVKKLPKSWNIFLPLFMLSDMSGANMPAKFVRVIL